MQQSLNSDSNGFWPCDSNRAIFNRCEPMPIGILANHERRFKTSKTPILASEGLVVTGGLSRVGLDLLFGVALVPLVQQEQYLKLGKVTCQAFFMTLVSGCSKREQSSNKKKPININIFGGTVFGTNGTRPSDKLEPIHATNQDPSLTCLIPQWNRHFVPFVPGTCGCPPWDNCPARAVR